MFLPDSKCLWIEPGVCERRSINEAIPNHRGPGCRNQAATFLVHMLKKKFSKYLNPDERWIFKGVKIEVDDNEITKNSLNTKLDDFFPKNLNNKKKIKLERNLIRKFERQCQHPLC